MLQHVADVAAIWPWVRKGLVKLLKKTGDDWTPHDVYNEIAQRQSHLYTINVRGERKGFVILQVWPTYHSGPRLFVRALWAEPNTLVEHRDDFYQELLTVAQECGCVALRMTSTRRWELDGWEPKQTIYEMRV